MVFGRKKEEVVKAEPPKVEQNVQGEQKGEAVQLPALSLAGLELYQALSTIHTDLVEIKQVLESMR